MKTWPALDVRFISPAPAEARDFLHEQLSAALDDLGPTAIQESEEHWLVFFANREGRDRAAAALHSALAGELDVSPLDVEDEDWAKRSQQDLTAVRIENVTITPPWLALRDTGSHPEAPPFTIVIQPSMGFGTGHHATTRLCTRLLQHLDLAGRTVLDVGTGSGVLALVAHALGAGAVVAVDDDADAVESARENLELNGVKDGIDLRVADFRGLAAPRSDVVVANLTGGLLVRSAEILAGAVAPGGSLIISGVTLEEEAAVVAAFAPWMTVVERMAEQEWMGAVLRGALQPGGETGRATLVSVARSGAGAAGRT
jgi:ribosomal protein L11 methyltransferase